MLFLVQRLCSLASIGGTGVPSLLHPLHFEGMGPARLLRTLQQPACSLPPHQTSISMTHQPVMMLIRHQICPLQCKHWHACSHPPHSYFIAVPWRVHDDEELNAAQSDPAHCSAEVLRERVQELAPWPLRVQCRVRASGVQPEQAHADEHPPASVLLARGWSLRRSCTRSRS